MVNGLSVNQTYRYRERDNIIVKKYTFTKILANLTNRMTLAVHPVNFKISHKFGHKYIHKFADFREPAISVF